MSIEKHVTQMLDSIREIEKIDPVIGNIFSQSFAVGANTLEAVHEADGTDNPVDISEYIEILNNIFGIDMKQIVDHLLESKMEESQKEADQNTLDFIMNDEDLDDYDRFVKENQAKENLDFLKNEI